MTSPLPEKAASQRLRNRIVIVVFGVMALIFIAGPFFYIQWGSRDFCPYEVKASGRSSGTDWEVTRSDCGGAVGVVWQVRITPTKGTSNLAFESRGGPTPARYEQKGFEGTVTLAEPAKGSADLTIPVPLDPRGRPVAAIKFVDGTRVE